NGFFVNSESEFLTWSLRKSLWTLDLFVWGKPKRAKHSWNPAAGWPLVGHPLDTTAIPNLLIIWCFGLLFGCLAPNDAHGIEQWRTFRRFERRLVVFLSDNVTPGRTVAM